MKSQIESADITINSCLLTGDENKACSHKTCRLAKKQPKYWGITIASLYDKKEFTHFRRHKSISGVYFLMPVNPYTKDQTREKSNFEVFRQAWELNIVGDWPLEQELYRRDEVSFVFEEEVDGTDVVEMVSFRVPINGERLTQSVKLIDELEKTLQERVVQLIRTKNPR